MYGHLPANGEGLGVTAGIDGSCGIAVSTGAGAGELVAVGREEPVASDGPGDGDGAGAHDVTIIRKIATPAGRCMRFHLDVSSSAMRRVTDDLVAGSGCG
jgi:hypothetical protein